MGGLVHAVSCACDRRTLQIEVAYSKANKDPVRTKRTLAQSSLAATSDSVSGVPPVQLLNSPGRHL